MNVHDVNLLSNVHVFAVLRVYWCVTHQNILSDRNGLMQAHKVVVFFAQKLALKFMLGNMHFPLSGQWSRKLRSKCCRIIYWQVSFPNWILFFISFNPFAIIARNIFNENIWPYLYVFYSSCSLNCNVKDRILTSHSYPLNMFVTQFHWNLFWKWLHFPVRSVNNEIRPII